MKLHRPKLDRPKLRPWVQGWAIVGLLALAACSNDKEVDPPAELVDITPKLNVKQLWSDSLGGDADRLRLALQANVFRNVVYAASHDGEVVALAAVSGKRLWRVKTKLALSAGPGVDESLTIVGAANGVLLALETKTGRERWRQTLSGEVLARPLVTADTVVVRTVDGRLHGLEAADGKTRWTVEQEVPRLSLRGNAPPVLANDIVVAGFDNGKLIGVDVRTGDALWNATIETASGRTELDRLIDIDAAAAVSGKDVYVVGFQGRIAMLDVESGQIWWAKEASSYRGFGLDERELFMTGANSVVTAMRRNDGAQQWEQTGLRQRGLSAPALDGDMLVVGDYEGYVHWLDKSNGEVAARAKTDGERITNAPVVADGRVFVQTDGGKLIAFQSKPIQSKSARAAQPPQKQPTQEQPTESQPTQAPPAETQPPPAQTQPPG